MPKPTGIEAYQSFFFGSDDYVYIYIYTHIYMYIYINNYLSIYMYIYISLYIYMYYLDIIYICYVFIKNVAALGLGVNKNAFIVSWRWKTQRKSRDW